MASRNLTTWLIEGVVIVASILLAFAIDAWWQDQVDVQAEADLIAAIVQDVERTQLEIERVLERNQMHAGAVRVFMDTTPEAFRKIQNGQQANTLLGAPGESDLRSFWALFALYGVTTFTPYLGSMTDTSLSSVSDPKVRGVIGNWLVEIADAQENTPGLFQGANEIKTKAAKFGAAQLMAQERGTISANPPTGGVTYADVLSSMRNDPAMVNAILRYHNQRDNSNRKIARLADATEALLAELRRYRDQL